MKNRDLSDVFGCPIEGEELLNDFYPLEGKMLCESIVIYLQKNNLIGRFEDGKFIVKRKQC
jgi:hypothetical protein